MKKILVAFAGLGVALVLGTTAFAGTNAVQTTIPGSAGFAVVKVREFINSNLMTFKKASKAELLDYYCDRRVNEMSYAQSISKSTAFDTSLNRYQDQKNTALNLAKQADSDSLMNKVNQNTLAQQKQMTSLQLMEQDQTRKEKIVEVQKSVAAETQTATTVVQGQDQGDKISNEINNVWYAEGTGAGDTATGGEAQNAPAGWTYAPGTSGSGEGGTTYSGGEKKIEGGTSGTSSTTYSGGTGASNVVGGTSGTGGQTVEGSNPNTASGTTGSGGTAATKVVK